ncbi:substrate-binding periplasmic protein [Aliikangiella sp. IMCC44653]
MNRQITFSFCLIALIVLAISGCNQADNSGQVDKATSSVKETAPAPSKQAVAALNKPAKQCSLTMGWDPWEPYQFYTVDDKVAGLEIELLTAIADEAGCDLKFEQKSWMKLLNAIRQGSIDLLGSASKTDAREKFAYFSNNYRSESFVLYVRKGEADKYANLTLEQMLNTDFKLGVTEDYVYGEQVSQLRDAAATKDKFVNVPLPEVNYYNLVQNNIDGFLEDPFVAAFTIKRKGLQDEIEALPLEIHSGDVALMFSKKTVSPETVEAFNQAIAKLKQDGTYQSILDKYSF